MSETDQEAAWIRQIAKGNKDAFEQLYLAYQSRLSRYLSQLVRNTADVEELLSDVMVAIWKGAGSYRGEAKPSTWIFGIAHHKALNLIRQRHPETVELQEDDGKEWVDPKEGPYDLLVQERLKEMIQNGLSKLSVLHREVVELTFYHGLSYPEIAEILSCPVNTVKTRMFHAKKQLYRTLEPIGMEG